MKKYFILAAAALAFAACTNEDAIVVEQAAEQQVGEVPVAFDTYVNRGVTRAGQTGVEDLTAVQTSGFGVFAYYTNADNYDQTFTPNFMYNQRVYGAEWTYAPLKYWPNEFGNGALSDDVDKVSFFAYAPFVSVNPTSGKVKYMGGTTYAADDGDTTCGIVGMKNNNATGDPMVKYISTFYTNKQVDLLWGTVPTSTTWTLKNTGAAQAGLDAGKPWLDVQHPKYTGTYSKLKFDFKHATARLNVTVDTKADQTATLQSPDGNTKVFIRSVTFEGFDTKGALNLNNTDAEVANWYNFDCCGTELNNGAETTIKDGRKDGKEGLTASTKEYAAINPNFVQDKVWGYLTATGVTGTAGNLFRTSDNQIPAETDPIFVIPNGDKLKVTIEYDVLTADNNLSGTLNDGQYKGSVVKNVITRWITKGASATGSATDIDAGDSDGNAIILKNGYQYTIKLHLGLNSVRFDAEVTPWEDAINGGADLPHNS